MPPHRAPTAAEGGGGRRYGGRSESGYGGRSESAGSVSRLGVTVVQLELDLEVLSKCLSVIRGLPAARQ